MTWHTQIGERTLQGAEAELIRMSLGVMLDSIETEIEGLAESWRYGIPVFDNLEPAAKLLLLAEVGWALLRDTPTCPELTAISEGAVAAIYVNVEHFVQIEIDSPDDDGESTAWRQAILAVCREKNGQVEELPEPACPDYSLWECIVEAIADRVLWDDDFLLADSVLDSAPEVAAAIRDKLDINDEYYMGVAPDPAEGDLAEARARLTELCGEHSG